MKKIPTLFKRNMVDHLVYDEIQNGAEWVIYGQGIATRKWDGTCCLIENGKFYKRYDAKHGKKPPEDFMPAQEADPISGHWPGWIPVKKEDKWHLEAWKKYEGIHEVMNGTFELVGPKINNNRDNLAEHTLIRHGMHYVHHCPTTFERLKSWLADKDIEGIVWYHKDGRMAKIKKSDFGLKRD